jgi:hypothetical protein
VAPTWPRAPSANKVNFIGALMPVSLRAKQFLK